MTFDLQLHRAVTVSRVLINKEIFVQMYVRLVVRHLSVNLQACFRMLTKH